MTVVVVTGAGGLVGAETVRFFHDKGLDVVDLDNDMRRYFFGEAASTAWARARLESTLAHYTHAAIDIRDTEAIEVLFARHGKAIVRVIHTAAQPSHDWAAREPVVDFTINANGTLTLLEATRWHCPEASFIHCSTNKVYGDTPNTLPLVEMETRWELDPTHP